MPRRGGGFRKKRRTHGPQTEDPKNIPRTFVIKRSKVTAAVKQLVLDWRAVMAPHSAMKLKEHNSNTVKDFVSVASVFGVTHLMVFTQSPTSPYLRIARTPSGPTLTFRIHQFSLCRDVRAHQNRSRVSPDDFLLSPLVVLNGFRQQSVSLDSPPLDLVTTVLGNMFPVIEINALSAKDCRRVVLFNYDKVAEMIDVRHFVVIKRPAGVSRNVKKLIRLRSNPRKVLDLGRTQDVDDFILHGEGSENEESTEISAPTKKKGMSENPSRMLIRLS